MRILDSIRGHFALLVKRPLETLSEGSPFSITRVVSTVPREEDWTVVVRPAGGKPNSIYVSVVLDAAIRFVPHRETFGEPQ
jgi:hypothetical protein